MRELIQDKLYQIKTTFLLNWILFVKDKLIFPTVRTYFSTFGLHTTLAKNVRREDLQDDATPS